MSQISQIKKIYHAAIYVRLSKEDGAVASHEKTESNSIANQKSLIRDFLENKNDIEVVQEYVDDGFSGSNFERPAFQMMLEDIKKGKIDCVVTKDLSRFGREYIDSGMYIERLFPAMGVRFIAINDGIDSGEAKSQSDEIIIPFKNLINDAYCRDISIKIRSHLEIKRKQGDVITAFVPYGYKKNDKDKHKLEIDVYAANVVKDIFRMKLHGKSQDAIACELNSSGILPPAEYKASTGSNYQTCFKTKEKSEWTSVMVRRILTNEVYIGNLVQGKQTTPNHKVKKTIIKEKCEWIRIEKNHEPVITDRDFEVVQRLLAMDTRTSPDREEVYPLSGVVTCGGCGIPMVRKTSKVGGKTYAYYLCATHKDSKQCSSHRISTDKLEEVVLELLQTHIDNMIDLKRILSFIGNVPFQQLDMKKLEERREKKQAEVDRCADLSVLIGRHHTYSEKFYYKCKNRRKLARLCENKYSYDYSEVMDSVFSVIRQHMSLCVEKTKFVQKMNSRKENVLQYDIYTKQIAKLQNDVRRITANKSGLYEDYREQLITAEELCQYQREYESRVNEIEAQITELLHRRSLYEKEFHIDEGWEETVNKYMAKRKLTKELVDAFVSEIVFYDGNIEVKLLYDDFLKELLKVAEEREVSSQVVIFI